MVWLGRLAKLQVLKWKSHVVVVMLSLFNSLFLTDFRSMQLTTVVKDFINANPTLEPELG